MASSKGLNLSSSQELKDLLVNAAQNESLSQDVREEAQKLSTEKEVTWRQLRPIYNAVRDFRHQDESAQNAVKASKLVIPRIPEKQKSPELVARLAKLQRQEDDRQYKAMTADVTVKEREAEDNLKNGPFANYADSLGYGVQIIVVMGVFYIMGHLAAASMTQNPAMKAVGGLVGLTIAMLVESILLMIRMSDTTTRHRRKRSKFLSTKPAAIFQKAQNELGTTEKAKVLDESTIVDKKGQ